MPAKRTTRADRIAKAFAAAYRMGKARTGLRDPEIAEALGYKSVISLRRRRQDMDKLSVAELSKLSLVLMWTDEEMAEIVRAMRS